MEDKLGRKLQEGEIVHHINENPLDNRPENLMVMLWGDHQALHNYLSPRLNHARNDRGQFAAKENING